MDVLDRAIAAGRIEELDGTPVFSLVSGPRPGAGARRPSGSSTSSASAVGLVSSARSSLAIALAIALDDGGPVLFRQRRVGLHGRPFDVVKFRSMRPDAEARRAELADRNEVDGHAFKIDRRPAGHQVGRFLRRTSLDELPQLWNVLRGEMSLVGPAAAAPERGRGLRPVAPPPAVDEARHHRPLAGPRPRDPDFDRWVEADLEYIDRWSLWLDVKILLRTIPAALEGR